MKEIQKISITDMAAESIKELITSGKYIPGQKLPTEASFCQMLGVSRTSIREALRVLQALGFVTIKPGKGTFVSKQELPLASGSNWYDTEDAKFSDFMEVRFAIEPLAVRLSVKRVTPKEVADLAEIHQSFLNANKTHDMAKLIMLDELFHTKIMSYTKNPLLININKQLLNCFRVYRGESFTSDQVYNNAVQPHGRILQCFYRKDPENAVLEMQRHLEITDSDMKRIHKKHTKLKSSIDIAGEP
ncbi:FadR family transcriptional regulator [Lacrimispora sp. NSJ-141]|uniref:FadR family transcriptional regulator n=1 Tax=Lientehia hominis TaxID=2897778 RepID=A0AAP2WAM2_9FIRM|nr:FadR/GntR family transcriptional regulator [Lientehia hominis]MCD2493479.1 FadR family transcriptional regulator [Lientehia hominis]